jgi:RNA polymerase sigma factor (sigma-70 family)
VLHYSLKKFFRNLRNQTRIPGTMYAERGESGMQADRSGIKAEFVAGYAEKIFYFCLRKCGGAAEAEDLAQDIILNVLAALGTAEPSNLRAYVWRIARNRYARWADANRRRGESVSGAVFDELDVPGAPSPEEDIARADDVRLLRRELAFIASDYRKIVVSHYIDNCGVSDIAAALNLPRGTVLSRLHRARNKIKEGFEMSREFGVLSYKPENVGFIMSGESGRDGALVLFEPFARQEHPARLLPQPATGRTPGD